MIPILGVPVMNRVDLISRLIGSIDFPIQQLVFVHNMDDGQPNSEVSHFLTKVWSPWIKHVDIHTYRTNLGCSAAWNTITLKHPSPWWLIVNSDISFQPGTLERINRHVQDTLVHNVCVWTFRGYSLFGISNHSIQTVGTFDENFWPAYAEDCDYKQRILHEKTCKISHIPHDIHALHTGSSTYKAVKNSKLFKRVTTGGKGFNNFDYLIRKWGKNVCYNDKDTQDYNGTKEWNLDVQRRIARGGPRECVACSLEMSKRNI